MKKNMISMSESQQIMDEELITLGENEYEVLKCFATDGVDDEHYKDGNGIYRFSATVERLGGRMIINPTNPEETAENIKLFIGIMNLLRIRPYRVWIYPESLEIDWASNDAQIVTSREKYLRLSLEFARYIDSIKACSMKVNTGSFSDSPKCKDELNNYIKNYNPCFTEESFGNYFDRDILVEDSTR